MNCESKNARYKVMCSTHNNRSLLILASILFIEQLFYGLMFTDPSTLIGRTHLFTAGVSAVYTLVLGLIFYRNKNKKDYKLWIHIVQFSYLLFLLGVSVYRAVYIPSLDVGIPVIYIAVLYGSAFLFYHPPLWSGFLYASTLIAFIVLSGQENHGVLYSTFVQDMVINNILAWLGSIVAYKRFIRQIDASIMIEQQNEDLLRLSSIDWLTQLSNRRQIDKSLEIIHKEAEETGSVYSIILADIDLFKQVNDHFGHTIGDKVLVEATNILKKLVAESYVLGRWGGEEFMILCKDTTPDEAFRIAEMLRKAVETHNFSVEQQITCSFGVGAYTDDLTMHDIVRHADEALYASKENGRNLVTLAG